MSRPYDDSLLRYAYACATHKAPHSLSVPPNPPLKLTNAPTIVSAF